MAEGNRSEPCKPAERLIDDDDIEVAVDIVEHVGYRAADTRA
jgi:hypothetical protein